MKLILKKPFDQWGERAFDKVRSLQGTVARSLETRKTLRFELEVVLTMPSTTKAEMSESC